MREAHSPRTLSDETRRNCLTKRNCRSLIPRSSPSPLLHPLPSPPASPLYHAQPPPSHPSFIQPISFIPVKSMSGPFDFVFKNSRDYATLSMYRQTFYRWSFFLNESSFIVSFFFSFVGIISRFPSDSVKVFSERSCCFTFNSNSCNSIYQKLEISEHWKSRKCLLEG